MLLKIKKNLFLCIKIAISLRYIYFELMKKIEAMWMERTLYANLEPTKNKSIQISSLFDICWNDIRDS